MTARRTPLAGLIVGLTLVVSADLAGRIHEVAAQLPGALSDDEFWQLSQQLSEANGFFRSDNLVSDEAIYRDVVPTLADDGRRHGVYLGVGPEQNFTYIAALDPQIAFIVDIRRGNLQLQLMYKALFEMSADRADFVSRLLTKPRPPGLSTNSSGTEIINAYWTVPTSSGVVYEANLQAIRDHLTKKRNLPLSPEDLAGIEYVYYKFYWFGPAITWASSQGGGASRGQGPPSFGALMKQTDASGRELSFLANEAAFQVVKNLQSRNLVLPVVGDFAGQTALHGIADYVRSHGAVVSAFYVSEVEPYLSADNLLPRFCANLAALPIAGASVLIRPPTVSVTSTGVRFAAEPLPDVRVMPTIASELKTCAARTGGFLVDLPSFR